MNTVWNFLALVGASAASYGILRLIFPGKLVKADKPVKKPKAPAEAESSGTAGEKPEESEVDILLKQGVDAVNELYRLRGVIPEPSVRERIDQLADLTGKIFADIVDDPEDIPAVKRFAGYYLPTTMKLLNAYDRMSGQGDGQNVSGTLKRIEEILDTTVKAYQKQYDSLFANEALDIETDISVMETMMKREGLTGKDFEVRTQGK